MTTGRYHREITAACAVARRYPGRATLDVRDDYLALSQAVSGYRGDVPTKLVVGILLHGFYDRAAVEYMAAVLRFPDVRGVSGMDWAISVRGTYEDMLAAGRSYGGRQGFPYRWIPSGTEVAESLGPYLGTLYDACVGIAALRIPSFSAIDSMLPQELGRYSMTTRSKCAYMRRHLARWMTRWLYPRGVPDARDWDLCLNGMGRAPRATAKLLKITSYEVAILFRRRLSRALGRKYSLFDLVCFLCLASNAIRSELKTVQRRSTRAGIVQRGSRFLVQHWDGGRMRYLGSVGTLREARSLYAARQGT